MTTPHAELLGIGEVKVEGMEWPGLASPQETIWRNIYSSLQETDGEML